MKLSLIFCAAAVGCIPQPVPPTPPQVVEITQVVVPSKSIEVIPDEPVIEPVRTWITGEELKALEEAREEEAIRDGLRCRPGDPLCSDIGETP